MKAKPKPPRVVILSGATNKGKILKINNSILPIEMTQSTHHYLVDFNSDGFDDLVYLNSYYGPPKFNLFNKKGKKFVELDYNPFKFNIKASFLYFADLNKDGVLDVLVATFNQKTELTRRPLRLYKGSIIDSKVKYTEIPNAFGNKTYPTSSIALLDYDMDGYLDLYMGNGFERKKGKLLAVANRFYKGKEFKFTDMSNIFKGELEKVDKTQHYKNAGPTSGVSICDVDQNGYTDLLVANANGRGNKLWLNLQTKNGERGFRDLGVESSFAMDQEGHFFNYGGGHSFYNECIDYNNDHMIDIAVGELFSSYDQETRDRSSILTGSSFNFPPKFLRTEYHRDDGTGQWTQGDRRANWIDLNFDGLFDLIVDNSGFPPKSRLIYFQQAKDHAFIDLGEKEGLDILNPSGTVFGDLNLDGRPDILTGQTNVRNSDIKVRPYFFENNYPFNGNRVLKVYLRGKKSNTHGIGATVSLKTKEQLMTQSARWASGYLPSQNADGLFFGVAKDDSVMQLIVRWPYLVKEKSGRRFPLVKRYNLTGLKFNNRMTITVCENGKYHIGRKSKCP